ncbi:MAG: BamA/TamA family outer membrane protein, partial [Muribaculaceae bacterium]|nr:BamA/TamA family outer membrane protein [Muribaculaceae bacterium]
VPSALDLRLVYSRQKYYENDRLFFEDNTPAFVSRHEAFARLSYGWAVGRRGKASIGVGGGLQRNQFYASDRGFFTDSGRAQTKMKLMQAIFRLEYNTLDNISYPASGTRIDLTGMQTLGRYNYTTYGPSPGDRTVTGRDQHWFQAEFKGERYIPFGSRFSLGGTVDVLVSNRKLLDSYYASLVNAPSFTPTVALEDVFNKAFHANSFAAVGIPPIWRPFQRAQVRLSAYAFTPFRKILRETDGPGARHGAWFADPEFIGELDLVYNLPFASVTGYVNYLSSPARNWNAGISFGLYFTADTFLR